MTSPPLGLCPFLTPRAVDLLPKVAEGDQQKPWFFVTMRVLLDAVNKNKAEESASFQNACHLQRKAQELIPEIHSLWFRGLLRGKRSLPIPREGRAWGRLPNGRDMDSVKFRTTQKTFGTILQWQCVKDKQILQDILFNILLVNVLLYWIMGIKGTKDPYRIFQKQYF